jgi:hypothetical protein
MTAKRSRRPSHRQRYNVDGFLDDVQLLAEAAADTVKLLEANGYAACAAPLKRALIRIGR